MDDQQYSRPFRGNRVYESLSDDDLKAVREGHARAQKRARSYSESSSESSRHPHTPSATPPVALPVGDAAGPSARVTRSSTRRSVEQTPIRDPYAALSSTPSHTATQVPASAAFATSQQPATHQQSSSVGNLNAPASQKTVICRMCDTVFTNPDSLQAHKKDAHMTCKQPNCTGKVQVFKHAYHYRHHMRTLHGIKVETHPRFQKAHQNFHKRRKSVQQENEDSDAQMNLVLQDSLVFDEDPFDHGDRPLQEEELPAPGSYQELRHDTEDRPREEATQPGINPEVQQHELGFLEANTINSLQQTIKQQQDKLDRMEAAMRVQQAEADQELHQQADAHRGEVANLTRVNIDEINRLRGGQWVWNYLAEQADERIRELEAKYQREVGVERDRHEREERRLRDLLGRSEEGLP
ncbi:hypothetical protein GE09DRAFT_586442 [Coniochaeta sp. 2T2.1]|nr:hypothetical protein GE09DRAFT_586442 [Coniochaeta sp. 2T2.1]